MPFNAANPADSERIRRLGTVIRPNWVAIEEGSNGDTDNSNPSLSQKLKLWSVNYFSRDDIPSAPGNDAPNVDNAIVMYSKTDSDTDQPEAFFRYEDASIAQLTKGPPNIAPSGFANNGETSIFGGLIIKYAFTDVVPTANPTYTWQGAGPLGLGLSDFPNEIFNIQVTRLEDTTAGLTVHVRSISTTGFLLRVPTVAPTTRLFILAIGR